MLLDGVVLPALSIFKGKRPLPFQEDNVFIRVQEKAWMDESMRIELVWEPATEGERSLLVLDSHITPAVKQKQTQCQ